ncbi:glycoside hydrolase family 18, partial [Bacteroides coprosuis]|uniref:glycoside hydrolase family 18 n=1 Tax=Bacteroides coprosuis TaxID=151276 RepID=UPI001D41A86E
KESDHEVSFGWFGGWNADQATMGSRLTSAPDSIDIISIWGKYWDITPAQKADLRYVQENYGTKVTYTIFAHEVPEPFEPTPEGVADYAKALADTMYKYNYDGIDLDYEPGFGGQGPLVGHDNKLMTAFVEALGKYFGPKSGTNKLFLIDGVPYAVEKHLAEYFDYGIVQAYSSPGDNDLQGRFNNALKKGWNPEQYIFAEDFERHWETGGYSSYRHTLEDGTIIYVPSLEGMARFQPTVDGEKKIKGGVGTYHMEYEYKHTPEYKYLRAAIQLMNPSK